MGTAPSPISATIALVSGFRKYARIYSRKLRNCTMMFARNWVEWKGCGRWPKSSSTSTSDPPLLLFIQMSDPTQFIVPLAIAHRLMTHEGVIAVGRDLFSGSHCSLHSYVDTCKRTYVMQLYDNLDPDTLSGKLGALAKYSHSAFLPNVVRPAFMSTRKSQKTTYQLAIFYENTGIGELTLEELITAKKKHEEKFQPQEITAFFWQVADFLFLSARGSTEYLDLSPLNFLCRIDGYYGYNFFLTNFGRRSQTKLYHNPKDLFYNGHKSFQTALSAAMFTFGLVLLEISCMLPTADLYEGGFINQKALSKRIEGVKITNDKMISTAIKMLLDMNEAKRLKPADIFKNEEWLKLRKVVYFSSKTDFFNFKNFEGIVEYDKKTSIGEALDQNLCMLRGTFMNGVFEGRGVREIKDCLQIGTFMGGELIQGQSVKKNRYIDIGKFSGGKIVQGTRIYLNIANLNKDNKALSGFVGDFQAGQPRKGKKIFTDSNQTHIQ